MNKNYIPTINISSLIKNNFENTKCFLKTIKEIEKACNNVGFFQIIGHGINLKELKKHVRLATNFLIYQTVRKENYHLKNGIKK